MPKTNNPKANHLGLNFAGELWAAADKMRGHMDASEALEDKCKKLSLDVFSPKSDWSIQDKPQSTKAAANRNEYLAVKSAGYRLKSIVTRLHRGRLTGSLMTDGRN